MEDKRPYEELKFYKDICEIRKYIFEITKRFDKTNLRLISQMRDAARSAKQNIREGYGRGILKEFLRGINISQGSLEELSGDMEDCFEDDLINKEEFVRFCKLYKSAGFLSTQYVRAMRKSENVSKWNISGCSYV